MDLQGKRVVVTGGAGFIGSHVMDHLSTEIGADAVALDDLSVGRRENVGLALDAGAELIVGDVRDRETVDSAFEGADVVIHMACDNLRASLGRPEHTHEVNATGSLVCALAAQAAGVERFVYVSSSEAYGTAVESPMPETHPLNPTTVYGAAKAAGELYAQGVMRTYGLPATVIRPFNSYGPREHAEGTSAEVIPKFTGRILGGEPPVIFGDGSQTRDFTWVEETAAGIVAVTACDGLVGESVNVAHGVGVSISEVARALLKRLGARDLEPSHEEERPGDVMHHLADTRKCREATGFEAKVEIDEGLARYVEWFRSQEALAGTAQREPVRNW